MEGDGGDAVAMEAELPGVRYKKGSWAATVGEIEA